jgi:hypothetical protein
VERSPYFKNGRFQNLVKTPMYSENTSMWQNIVKFIKGGNNREPKSIIETIAFNKQHRDENELSVTWFGHSTVLLQIAGKNLLVDPIFSNHASPFSFMGPKAFSYAQC